jgi:hypothetical protein
LVGPDNPDAAQMKIPIRNDNPTISEDTVPFSGIDYATASRPLFQQLEQSISLFGH